MALNELEQRRNRLEEYQIKARFALAESYDRATKAQEQKLKEEQEKKFMEQQAATASTPAEDDKVTP